MPSLGTLGAWACHAQRCYARAIVPGALYDATYPEPLQEAVQHARRLVASLTLVPLDVDEWGAAWITGRDEEIECIVGMTLDAWRLSQIDAESAARRLEAYVAGLHGGLVRFLHVSVAPCCGFRPFGAHSTTGTAMPGGAGPVQSFAQPTSNESSDDLLNGMLDSERGLPGHSKPNR